MTTKKVTYLCIWSDYQLDFTTVPKGLFEVYHSSSAAVDKQHLGVTKQPPFGDWGGSSKNVTDVETSFCSYAEERSVAGV